MIELSYPPVSDPKMTMKNHRLHMKPEAAGCPCLADSSENSMEIYIAVTAHSRHGIFLGDDYGSDDVVF